MEIVLKLKKNFLELGQQSFETKESFLSGIQIPENGYPLYPWISEVFQEGGEAHQVFELLTNDSNISQLTISRFLIDRLLVIEYIRVRAGQLPCICKLVFSQEYYDHTYFRDSEFGSVFAFPYYESKKGRDFNRSLKALRNFVKKSLKDNILEEETVSR